jgi:hypothetical protein
VHRRICLFLSFTFLGACDGVADTGLLPGAPPPPVEPPVTAVPPPQQQQGVPPTTSRR